MVGATAPELTPLFPDRLCPPNLRETLDPTENARTLAGSVEFTSSLFH